MLKTYERQLSVATKFEDFLLPRDPDVAVAVSCLAEDLSVVRLQQIFSETSAGRHLADMPRFQTFFQPEGYANEDWMKLLGAQGNDLRHGEYTVHTGEILLDEQPSLGLSPDIQQVERFLFSFTNLTHDWGEAHPMVGDVAFGAEKKQRSKERFMRSNLARQVLSEGCAEAGLAPMGAMRQAIDEIIEWSDRLSFKEYNLDQLSQTMDPEFYYLHLYRANKYLGHFSVALRAGRIVHEMADNRTELISNLKYLNALVACNDVGVLLQYSGIFPGIDRFLRSYQPEVDEALDNASNIFTNGIPRDNQELPLSLGELKQKWLEYCGRSSFGGV
ncbi:MAG TPA: hypothetical protein VHD84_01425 [Candidatus Saccharimonadales bacterium]|nr:hypothetical protein [Candidatus Saccharimonadales bacterium]